MKYKLNMFRSRKPLSDLGIRIYGYRVLNLGQSQNRFDILRELGDELNLKLNTLSTRYTPSQEENYVLIFNPKEIPEEIRIKGFILKLEVKNEELKKFLTPVKRLFYNLTRKKLEYHGFWRASYNKYYSLSHDKIVRGRYGEYKVFRGIFFRYEVIDNYLWLILDPVTRIVMKDSIWILISKFGEEKVKRVLREGRYVVTSQFKGGTPTLAIRKVLGLRDDFRAGKDKVIEKDDKWYTVKSWYSEYKDLPKIAQMIDDDEPLLETMGKVYYTSSMAYLVLRTKDIEGESRLKDEIYLTPERRFSQARRFLNVIDPLYAPGFHNIPRIEFLEKSVSFSSLYLEPPDICFGAEKSLNLRNYGGFENYIRFFKDNLKRYGPVSAKVRFSTRDRLTLIYPRELAEEQVKKFYLDVKKIAGTYFRTRLPPKDKLYLWDYSENDIKDIRENYYKFKGNIKGIITILSDEDDPLYFEFKRIFQDTPCQMTVKNLVLSKYDLPHDKIHLYYNSILNLTSGFLGKIGVRPWLLGKRLGEDLYMGIDTMPGKTATFVLIDNMGNFIGEARRPIKGSKIEKDVMKDSTIQFMMENLRNLPNKRSVHLVIHRDGDIYPAERQGLLEAIESLKQRGFKIILTLVSIKKYTPYRIFKRKNNEISAPSSGVYVKLDENLGLLTSVGWPLIKQGLPKPLLIEIDENDKFGYTLKKVIEDIYYLSFIHWGGVIKKIKMPVTIKYADEYAVFAEKGIDIIGPPL